MCVKQSVQSHTRGGEGRVCEAVFSQDQAHSRFVSLCACWCVCNEVFRGLHVVQLVRGLDAARAGMMLLPLGQQQKRTVFDQQERWKFCRAAPDAVASRFQHYSLQLALTAANEGGGGSGSVKRNFQVRNTICFKCKHLLTVMHRVAVLILLNFSRSL